jgi:hypothetical protein
MMIKSSGTADTTRAKKLTLRRESLRELTTAELGQVAGGTSYGTDSGQSLGCPKPSNHSCALR